METVVTDRQGALLTLHTILTITPIEHAEDARQIAADYLGSPAVPEDMLDLNLRRIGTSEVTHVGCLRSAWCDEVLQQSAFMTARNESWVDGGIRQTEEVDDKFCMYAALSEVDLLSDLGLETVP